MKNKLVVKSNDLIAANYILSLNEQKMVLYTISKINRNDDEFNFIDLNIREFIDLLGITDRNYEAIRNIARGLRKKEIIIDTDDFEYITGWFSGVTFDKSNGNIRIRFDDDLIPYLLKLKNRFTRYELKNILALKSAYSIRIYELLKQYENIGKRSFKIEELRKLLGLGTDKYLRIYDFERWVLKVAKKEINKETDIFIDYEKIRTGRRITKILFKINKRDQEDKMYIEYLNKEYDIEDMKLEMGLREENFSTEQIIEIYSEAVKKLEGKDEKDIFEYIKINYINIKNKARNTYAYLLKAVQNDYACAIGQIKFNNFL